MTRNSRKFNKKPQQNYSPPKPEIDQKPENPFGLSFVVPTEDVEIPTRGNYYPTSSPFCGVKKVEIKHMTAREEDLLSTLDETNDQNIFNTLINSLMTDKNLKAELMHEEDKMAVLLKARATGYGSQYKARSLCPHCNQTTDFIFDLNKSSVVEPENNLEYCPDQDCFEITLPVSKIKAKLRTLNDKDLQQIDKEKRKKQELNISFNLTISKINKMLISANEVVERHMLSQLAEVLPAADAKTILNFHDSVIPKISTKQTVTCSGCQGESEKEVPLSWAFFRTDI